MKWTEGNCAGHAMPFGSKCVRNLLILNRTVARFSFHFILFLRSVACCRYFSTVDYRVRKTVTRELSSMLPASNPDREHMDSNVYNNACEQERRK